ncbi:hypothetical protein [Shimazuella kribbensis]|uniref:hypothetical protein n=1 Tax=Shimazuella kribbensis TaxID=139808 RepID=UPI00048C5CDB|nr:hypothetical protein [Shimazuella kribbensis]
MKIIKLGQNDKVLIENNDNQDETIGLDEITFDDFDVNKISKQMKSRKKKVPFEEKYTRRTLWIRNDLNGLLNLELENDGNITEVVNDALKLYYNMKAQGLLDDK